MMVTHSIFLRDFVPRRNARSTAHCSHALLRPSRASSTLHERLEPDQIEEPCLLLCVRIINGVISMSEYKHNM